LSLGIRGQSVGSVALGHDERSAKPWREPPGDWLLLIM